MPNKNIIISILPLLEYGMKKEEFVNKLESEIYSELDKIN
jgi:hypothetical protein